VLVNEIFPHRSRRDQISLARNQYQDQSPDGTKHEVHGKEIMIFLSYKCSFFRKIVILFLMSKNVNVIGAGLVGSLLSIYLAPITLTF